MDHFAPGPEARYADVPIGPIAYSVCGILCNVPNRVDRSRPDLSGGCSEWRRSRTCSKPTSYPLARICKVPVVWQLKNLSAMPRAHDVGDTCIARRRRPVSLDGACQSARRGGFRPRYAPRWPCRCPPSGGQVDVAKPASGGALSRMSQRPSLPLRTKPIVLIAWLETRRNE